MSIDLDKGLSYSKLKSDSEAKAADDQREELLRKSVLVLIQDFLIHEGYGVTADQLASESALNLQKYEACDNIDLLSIVKEFQVYYDIKFKRAPKLTRKCGGSSGGKAGPAVPGRVVVRRKPSAPDASPVRVRASSIGGQPPLPEIRAGENGHANHRASSADGKAPGRDKARADSVARPPRAPGKKSTGGSSGNAGRGERSSNGDGGGAVDSDPGGLGGLDIGGVGITTVPSSPKAAPPPAKRSGGAEAAAGRRGIPQVINYREELQRAIRGPSDDPQSYDYHEDRMRKPITNFASNYTGEMATLAQVISRDIYMDNPDVRWADLIGLDEAKKVMREAVVYPIRYPQLFRGILSPWKGLLMFGPPGTGKTMLAKAVATECETTFFNISASSIVSKWRGDSEKLVRVLFELARFHAPSTIFLDELDSIMSTRGGGGGTGEHEGSRRMKTELLVQMDGLSKSDDLVFVLAASNLPWELDPAMLRRLEKRILIDMPSLEARAKMFESHLPKSLSDGDVEITCDIDYIALAGISDNYSGSDIRLVCKEAAMRPLRKVFNLLEAGSGDKADFLASIKLDPITMQDVETAISTTKPSASTLLPKYREWQAQFESV